MGKKFEVSKELIQGYDWIQSHRADLHKKYEGKWIAVYIDKVIAAGKSFGSVEEKAIKATGIPQAKIPLVFMEDLHCIYHFIR